MTDAATRIAVVDQNDRFLRWEDRRAVHEHHLVHRSVHILVFDGAGRLVLQRRHPDKTVYPDHWDASASGHVEEPDYVAGIDEELDRVYAITAERELEEELGVRAPLREVGHFGPEAGLHYEQTRLFTATSDGPFTIQADEVAELRRVSWEELLALTSSEEPVTPTVVEFARRVRERGGWPGSPA